MGLLAPEELADARAAFLGVLTDTAHVLRAETGAQAQLAATAPAGAGLSNGAGGVKPFVQPDGTPTLGAAQTWPEVASYPCRLGSYPRGIGELLVAGATQGKSSYRLKLPHDAQILPTDRVRVVTDDSDFVYEVIAVEPRSSQMMLAARLTRIT